jgi:F420H(2)-dependent quinone reductase
MRETPVVAREVTDPDERARLWALVVAAFPLYAEYQDRTERRIPLIVLEERSAS